MHDHEHQPLPWLLDGIRTGLVGSPNMPIAAAPAAALAPAGRGNPIGLLNLSADLSLHGDPQKLGRVPRVLTCSVFGVGSSGMGPLVGVARWGSGNGGQQEIEFDIPLALPSPAVSNNASSGAILAVPATALSLFARNDGNLLVNVGGDPIGTGLGVPATPPTATASLAIGHKQSNAQLTRTVWGVNAGAGLANGASVDIGVPAWAQRFRVFRNSANNGISVSLLSLGLASLGGPYNEAANATPAFYVLPSTASIVRLTNLGPGGMAVVGIVFELGL